MKKNINSVSVVATLSTEEVRFREEIREALEKGVSHPAVRSVFDGGKEVSVLLENGRSMRFRCEPIWARPCS